MIYNTFEIRVEGSQPAARLTTYVQDYTAQISIETSPLVLICPGGYSYLSDRTGEPLAMRFLAFGYHTAVLRYSVAPAVFPTALAELASAVMLIRKNVKEWHVDPDKVIVLGSSAGGHLAASLGILWDEDFLAQALGLEKSDHRLLRPDGMILCYPLITSGEFAYRNSFRNLLGEREAELSEQLSLETRVSEKKPPVFKSVRGTGYRYCVTI